MKEARILEQDHDEVPLVEDEARPAAWRWAVAFLGLFAGGSVIAIVLIGLLIGAFFLFFLILSEAFWACLLGGECGGRSTLASTVQSRATRL